MPQNPAHSLSSDIRAEWQSIKTETFLNKTIVVGWGVAVLCSSAWAQSSATLYGSVDVGLDFVSNSKGSHLFQESAGKRTPDRFGFRVMEDLGGGNSVIARLESGFLTNTGAQINPTSFFNRTAEVSLQNNSFGTLSLGNIPDYIYEYVGALNNSVPGISSFYTVGNLDGLANTHALVNSVKYDTPDFYGFRAGVMNSFGGQAGDFSEGRQYSIGAQFVRVNQVKFGVAYTMSHDRTADVFGIFGVPTLLGQTLRAGTMFNAARYSTFAVGGSVVIGAFTPHLTFTDVKLANLKGSKTERNYQAGVNIDLTGERLYLLGISYNRSLFEDLTFNQYNLFLTYYLSKSTQVYAGAGLQRASGPHAQAEQFGYLPSSTGSQTVARIGINHLF
jgi:predicted porin